MNFDDLTRIWHSHHNRPSGSQMEQEKMQFITDLRRRHRALVVFMSMVFVALAIPTGNFLHHLIWRNPAHDSVDFSREWAILPLLALPWAAWLYFAIQYRRHRQRHPDYEISIRASLQALLDENRGARKRTVVIGCLQLGLVLNLPLAIQQLKAVGKAGDEVNVMLVLVPALLGSILLGMAWHFWRTLLPRKRELETLLAAYPSHSERQD